MSEHAAFFSHVYIEDDVRDHPRTHAIREHFPKATVVAIRHYKEVFNRPRQDWALQKESRQLILAKRHDNFLYPGAAVTSHHGFAHYYYNALILNCMYDCSYCYLQGLYPSANVVIFVNNEDYFDATRERLKSEQPMYLCISYDTDLLAFEKLVPYASSWIDFAEVQQNLTIELRTKSAAYAAIAHCKPNSRTILAWTLSPQLVIDRYEARTPPLQARLAAVRAAITDGWKVRLCFDPILAIEAWESTYEAFVASVFSSIDLRGVREVSLGTFRMNKAYLEKIRSWRREADILYHPFSENAEVAGYSEALSSRMLQKTRELVASYGVSTV